MKFSEGRLRGMIRHDPSAVVYSVGAESVEANGLLHRRPGALISGDSESSAGSVSDDRLRVLLVLSDLSGVLPEEGTLMTVAGVQYRSGGYDIASDNTHITVLLLDPNA